LPPPRRGPLRFQRLSVDHLVEFPAGDGGQDSHVVAVCQPCVPVLAAIALMAEDGDEAQPPAAMTLMAGPIDTRVNPNQVNELAIQRPITGLSINLITEVPSATRALDASLSWLHADCGIHEPERSSAIYAPSGTWRRSRAAGDQSKFQFIQAFLMRNISRLWTCRLIFYLETVKLVFQTTFLPLGELKVHWRPSIGATIKALRC